MSIAEFVQVFREFMGRNGWYPDRSPWAVVEGWEHLVGEIEEGYQGIEVEYTNDLSVRDILEKAFKDDKLNCFETPLSAMRARVAEADDRLRKVFLPDVQIGAEDVAWWRRGVLSRAGLEYTADMERIYGIKIEDAGRGGK